MAGKIEKIKHLPGRITPYLRFRHARGHGIHSPFAYGLIRNALLYGKGGRTPGDVVFEILRENGVSRRRAAQIQNLHNYCNYGKAEIFNGDDRLAYGQAKEPEDKVNDSTLKVFTRNCPAAIIQKETRTLMRTGGTSVVLAPRLDRERHRLCMELTATGDCISIDNRGFMLFIYGSGHTPRHYKL